jgi:hypothetical protein
LVQKDLAMQEGGTFLVRKDLAMRCDSVPSPEGHPNVNSSSIVAPKKWRSGNWNTIPVDCNRLAASFVRFALPVT